MNNQNITLVSCYYDIRNFENNKEFDKISIMNSQKYLEDIKTIFNLKFPLIIFTESKFEDLFKNYIEQERPEQYKQYTKIIIKNYEELTHYDKLNKLQENYLKNPVKNLCKVKFTPLYNLVISNKTEFIKDSIQYNFFNTEKFAWIDVKSITFLNYSTEYKNLLNIDDIPKIFDNFVKNRITIIEMAFTSKNELNNFYYDYTRGKVAATFFGGYKDTLLTFSNLVEKEFLKTIEEGRCVCEEQIYGWITGEYPELFEPIFGDYGSHFVNNFIIKKDINLVLNYLQSSYNNHCHYKTYKCSKILVNTIEKTGFIPENIQIFFNIYNYGYISSYYLNKKEEAEKFILKLLELSKTNFKIYNYIKEIKIYFKMNTQHLNNTEIDSKINELFFGDFEILYGVEGKYRNVTKRALLYFSNNSNNLHIPKNDNRRAEMFGDHLPNVLKHIIVKKDGKEEKYEHDRDVNIDISDILQKIDISSLKITKNDWFDRTIVEPMQKLQMIHDNILFKHGSLRDEFPEQVMAATFIEKDNCVLELGANTGRNTVVIASILEDEKNLVTLETDPNTCRLLEENRNINNYNFHIENSALSKRPLIQNGWSTVVSDNLLPGHFRVNNITFEELEKKYEKKFDTLVADCEGALFYIFQDFPDMLQNINTIIMENDYNDFSHKQKVDEILTNNGFKRVYAQAGGWGPCYNCFFETWKK